MKGLDKELLEDVGEGWRGVGRGGVGGRNIATLTEVFLEEAMTHAGS